LYKDVQVVSTRTSPSSSLASLWRALDLFPEGLEGLRADIAFFRDVDICSCQHQILLPREVLGPFLVAVVSTSSSTASLPTPCFFFGCFYFRGVLAVALAAEFEVVFFSGDIVESMRRRTE
jgi:hypothetical protein